MVKVRKWFIYASFNQIITAFKYNGGNANDKPKTVDDKGHKLGGHAVQNWCLLRLFPILIGNKIQNKSDNVWKLIIFLRQIVELVCPPKIALAQVAYLRIQIEEYLELRMTDCQKCPNIIF